MLGRIIVAAEPVRNQYAGGTVGTGTSHHLGDVGSRLSEGDQMSLNGTGRKRGRYGPGEELIPIIGPEVRWLLTPPGMDGKSTG